MGRGQGAHLGRSATGIAGRTVIRGGVTMNDEARIAELIAELQTMTADPTAATSSRLSTLVDELRHETATADAMAGGAALEAARAPLIHRSKGKTQNLLVAITAPGQHEVCLTPQGGSARREAMLDALGETPSVYFWVGFCAYEHDDPDLVMLWAPEAEQTGPSGHGAPWDTAGLTTKGTLGRNLPLHEARQHITRYSLPTRGSPADYRRYLAEVLKCSFAQPFDMFEGRAPARWYPGWEMSPPRVHRGGVAEVPPHHTFEVRRGGTVPLAAGLLGIVVKDGVFRTAPGAQRTLRDLLKQHAVWDKGRRLLVVGGEDTVGRAVRALVRQWMAEEGGA